MPTSLTFIYIYIYIYIFIYIYIYPMIITITLNTSPISIWRSNRVFDIFHKMISLKHILKTRAKQFFYSNMTSSLYGMLCWGGINWLNQWWISISSPGKLKIINWLDTNCFWTDFFLYLLQLKCLVSQVLLLDWFKLGQHIFNFAWDWRWKRIPFFYIFLNCINILKSLLLLINTCLLMNILDFFFIFILFFFWELKI